MKASVEIGLFCAASVALHLTALALTMPDGMSAGGSGGDARVTQSAMVGSASSEMMALAQAWEQPVTTLSDPRSASEPSRTDIPPALPDTALAADMPPGLPSLPEQPALPDNTILQEPSQTPPLLFDMPPERTGPRPRARPDPAQARASTQPRRTGSPERPGTRAAGQGASTQSGSGPAPSTSGSTTSATALAQWGGAIRAAIQRRQSRVSGNARGHVQLQLSVSADGRLNSVRIMQSSGVAAVDNAAVAAVRAARLPRAPQGVSGSHVFNLPLTYQ